MKRIVLFCALVALASAASAQTFTGSATSVSTIGPFSSSGRTLASVSVSGTYAGLSAVFEFSDGVSGQWFSAFGVRSDASVQEIGPAAISNTARMWDISVFSTQQFRIRVTNFESGTANFVIVMSNASIEAAPTVAIASGSAIAVTGLNSQSVSVFQPLAPPPLSPLQQTNPLLWRAAMRGFCFNNLSPACAPGQ